VWEDTGVGLDDGDDDAEDAEGRGENLDDQNLDEEGAVLRIGQGAAAPRDADGDTVAWRVLDVLNEWMIRCM
jgi:hypothetical protein